MATPNFEIRGSSETRRQMTRIRAHIFTIIEWYARLGFRDMDIVNDQDRDLFPQELLAELHQNRTELSWGSIPLRNKAFEFVKSLRQWRDNLSYEALERMEYFRIEPPWGAINGAIAEAGEVSSRRQGGRHRRDALLVASIR